MASSTPVVAVGDFVLYVMKHGAVRPALVVDLCEVYDKEQDALVADGNISLQVFANGRQDGPDYGSSIYWAESVKYNADGKAGTWHAKP